MARQRNTDDNSKEELPKARFNLQNLKQSFFIFKYIRPYRATFVIAMLFIACSSLTTLAFPYLLKMMVDSANDIGMGKKAFSPGLIALAMLAVLSVQAFFSFSRVYLFARVGENALADLRKDVYTRMILMPMDFFSKRRVGELSSRISADLSQIEDTVTSVLAELLRGIFVLVIGIGMIFYISARLSLLMFSVIPLIVIGGVTFSRFIRKVSRQSQDQLAESNTIVQESLQGISNVKSFSNEWFEISRYSESLAKVVKLAIRTGKYRGFFISFMMFSMFGSIILVTWYGAGLMQNHQLTFGNLMAFVVYTAFVGGTMAGFADLFAQLQKTIGATQRVKELMTEIPELEQALDVEIAPEHRLKGDVAFEHISFTYPSRTEMKILSDLSFRAESGQQIAIVGPSGAGKSTLISLLLRFYEPQEGEIRFDDKNASAIPLAELRKQIALVPQDILLFGGSILENISYGNPHASLEEIQEAAKKANAHDFIMSFPEGYNTLVGERGIKLSGGQRQRIAIARAILKDPVILILDEATSSLDSASEALVQEALDNLMKNRTSFVIAHRLSTVRSADQILVLEKGQIKERGTHQKLLLLENGLYKDLNRIQFEGRSVQEKTLQV